MEQHSSPRQDVDTDLRLQRGSRCARWSPLAWIVLFLTIILGVGADLGSKHLAFQNVHDHPIKLTATNTVNPQTDPTRFTNAVYLLPGDLLALRLTLNRGAVFGFGANQRLFFIVFTIAACIGAMYVFGYRTRARHHIAHIAIGLVLAGALGNFYDRIVFHAVRDFIQIMPKRRLPEGWTWPGGNPEMFPWVFNIADVFLLVGVIMLMTHIRKKRKRRAQREQTEATFASAASS